MKKHLYFVTLHLWWLFFKYTEIRTEFGLWLHRSVRVWLWTDDLIFVTSCLRPCLRTCSHLREKKKTEVIWWMNSYHFTWKAGPWLAEMCHTLRKPFRRPIRAHLSPPQWAVMACIVISLIAQSRVPPTGQPVRVVYKWAAVGSWRSIFRLSGGFCQLPFSFCFRSSMRWVRVSRARFSRSWGKIRYVHYNNRPPFLRHRTHTHTRGYIAYPDVLGAFTAEWVLFKARRVYFRVYALVTDANQT